MTPVSSWGRLGSHAHRQIFLNDRYTVGSIIRSHQPGIAFGHGRSYGDVCLNPGGTLWKTRGLDRFISFDPDRGLLSCEAGVLLRDIHRLVISQGWMLPVTPGTQLVTVGGAIANDVHGKNHHRYGSFGHHVEKIRLLRTYGEIIDCGPDQRSEWFCATLGGLGLTGLIMEATLQLRKIEGAWLQSETIPYKSLEQFFELADASEEDWEHTVSWIDCMDKGQGRGLFMRANHIKSAFDEPKDRQRKMPFSPPISLINGLSLRPLNWSYYHLHRLKTKRAQVHYKPFFYPLDHVLEWNRLYGPKGFYQYQSVVPLQHGRDSIRAMLQAIATSGEGSFLAVLKTFGDRQSPGLLSFPGPGVTLALDFPNRNDRTHRLLERLDAVVREAGGRIYPAKDARMPRDLFESGYPKLGEFLNYRDAGISSALSRRLMGS